MNLWFSGMALGQALHNLNAFCSINIYNVVRQTSIGGSGSFPAFLSSAGASSQHIMTAIKVMISLCPRLPFSFANALICTLYMHTMCSNKNWCLPPPRLTLNLLPRSSHLLLRLFSSHALFSPAVKHKSTHLSTVWICCQSPISPLSLPRWHEEMCMHMCRHART